MVRVSTFGRVRIGKRKNYLNTIFTGKLADIRQVAEKVWLVSFLD